MFRAALRFDVACAAPAAKASLARLALLLPALAAAGLTLFIAYRGERENTEKLLAGTTRALSLAVDRQLGQAEAAFFALAASPHLETGDPPGLRTDGSISCSRTW